MKFFSEKFSSKKVQKEKKRKCRGNFSDKEKCGYKKIRRVQRSRNNKVAGAGKTLLTLTAQTIDWLVEPASKSFLLQGFFW